MKTCLSRPLLLLAVAAALAGCGNRETQKAIDQANQLDAQGDYQKANSVLVDALSSRDTALHDKAGPPADAAAAQALIKTVQADPEILKLERAQIVIYLHMDRPDLASAVYSDIIGANPGDTIILDVLKNKDAKVRAGAVSILGLAGKADSIPALIQASKDEDKDVRRAAIAALGTIKDPQVFDPLLAALKDSYWFTRSAAAEGLRQQGNPAAIKPLLELVTDSDSSVEGSAEKALMVLSRAPGANAEDFYSRLNDPNPKIQLISAVCLVQMDDARVIPYLRKWLSDPDVDARGWSIIGLGKLKDKDSLPALQAIADNPQEVPKIRAAAGAAVNYIEGKLPPAAPQ